MSSSRISVSRERGQIPPQKTQAISEYILIAERASGDGSKVVIYRTPSLIASPSRALKITHIQNLFINTNLILLFIQLQFN